MENAGKLGNAEGDNGSVEIDCGQPAIRVVFTQNNRFRGDALAN
jgi:hypothetical protein